MFSYIYHDTITELQRKPYEKNRLIKHCFDIPCLYFSILLQFLYY